MNKTTIKIFLSFSFVAAVIATLLLILNALGLGILASDTDLLLQLEGKKKMSVKDFLLGYDVREENFDVTG